jgi:hypothetical protein
MAITLNRRRMFEEPRSRLAVWSRRLAVFALIVSAKDAELTTVRTFFGGQGSGNTGGWAPDSKKFAWTEYETIPEPAK